MADLGRKEREEEEEGTGEGPPAVRQQQRFAGAAAGAEIGNRRPVLPVFPLAPPSSSPPGSLGSGSNGGKDPHRRLFVGVFLFALLAFCR